MTRQGDGCRLGTWDSGTASVLHRTWPADVPLPAGYLDVLRAPAGESAVLAAVRPAADRWAKAQAVAATTVASTDSTTGTTQGRAATGFSATGTAAPACGDDTSGLTYGESAPQRSVQLDHGRRVLTQVNGTLRAVPGKTLQSGLAWTSNDTSAPATANASYGDNPFGRSRCSPTSTPPT